MKLNKDIIYENTNYIVRSEELLAINGTLRRSRNKNILISGLPGCGKTAFAETVATTLGSPFYYHLLHSWSDDQELFAGINVSSAVAGDADRVHQDGVLAKAAKASQKTTDDKPVILCLDEIDKTQERTEYLLLDFLQSGRVPVRPGEFLQADLSKLVVICTTNNERELAGATLRRFQRVNMKSLKTKTIDEILSNKTGLSTGIVKLGRKAAYSVAESEQRPVSEITIQELENMLLDCKEIPQSKIDCGMIVKSWASKEDTAPDRQKTSAFWAELKKIRGVK